MNEQSAWDIPIKKDPNAVKLFSQPKNFEKSDQEIPSFLNKHNIFSQPPEFYASLKNSLPNDSQNNDINSNFSCSNGSLNRKNEQNTTQLINLLNTLGININSKEFKPTDDKEKDEKDLSNEIVLRVKQGTYVSNFEAKSLEIEPSQLICKENCYSFFTKDGKNLVITDNNSIVRYSFESKTVENKITKTFYIMNVAISNKGCFVVTVDKIDKENFILSILDMNTLNPKYEAPLVKYKREHWPLIKFDCEDHVAFKKTSQECIEILDASKNFEVLKVCQLEKFNYFFVSPRTDALTVVFTFVEHAQGFENKSSRISIANCDDLSKPIFTKNLEKAQEINPIFSPDGHKLLILTQTYMDETGKSYYGEITLYYYDMENKTLKKVPTYEGPVHDVSWNPNSEEFIVISGFMPAASVLFDKSCNPIFEFGKHHRNTIKWSPLSNLVCLGGFGNLSGDIEIWDTKKFERVGSCKSNSAVSCIWAPDGRKFLTGVLNPRLRVDNNFKVFRYNGKLLNSMSLNHTELYEVDWKPSTQKYQEFNASPKLHDHKEEKKEEKPRKIFKPKGTGQLSAILKAEKQTQGARVLKQDEKFGSDKIEEKKEKEDVTLVRYPPGYVPPEPKKKKKRIRKKKETGNQNEEDGNDQNNENDEKEENGKP